MGRKEFDWILAFFAIMGLFFLLIGASRQESRNQKAVQKFKDEVSQHGIHRMVKKIWKGND